MTEHNIPNGLFHEAYQLFECGHSSEEVKARFEARELDPALIDELVSTVRAIRMKKRRARGVIFSGIGAVTLVLAFGITYALHHFGINTDIALYGLTTLGITFLFIGMIFFMG